MKGRPFSKRERTIAYLALGLFALSLTFNLLVRPTFARLRGVNQDIEKKTFLLEKYIRLKEEGQDLLALYDNYQKALETQSSPDEVVSGLFDEIKTAAKKFRLNLDKIKPLPQEAKKGYKEISLEVELEGNFASIFQFINHLENTPSFITVTSLRLFPGAGKSTLLRCRITFSRVFF